MSIVTKSFHALLFCLAASQVYAETCPEELRIGFPDFKVEPYLLGTKEIEKPPGLFIEWINNALPRTGCTIKVTYHRRPVKRLAVELESGQLDMTMGIAYTPETSSYMAYPIKDGTLTSNLLIARDEVNLYVRAEETDVQWDGKILKMKNPNVGISSGFVIIERIVKARGWPIDLAANPSVNLKKLQAKRVDAILEPNIVFVQYLSESDAKTIRKLTPPVVVADRFAPVSKKFQQSYPEFTQRLWYEVCKESRTASPALPACPLQFQAR
jgi:hypothetical protein